MSNKNTPDSPRKVDVQRQPDSEAARAGVRDLEAPNRFDNAENLEDDDAVSFDEVDDLEDVYDSRYDNEAVLDQYDFYNDDVDDLDDDADLAESSPDAEELEVRRKWDEP